jgi:hypothetical protein
MEKICQDQGSINHESITIYRLETFKTKHNESHL